MDIGKFQADVALAEREYFEDRGDVAAVSHEVITRLGQAQLKLLDAMNRVFHQKWDPFSLTSLEDAQSPELRSLTQQTDGVVQAHAELRRTHPDVQIPYPDLDEDDQVDQLVRIQWLESHLQLAAIQAHEKSGQSIKAVR